MNIAIRLATPGDAILIADLSHKTFYDTFAADNSKEDMDKFLNEQFTKGKLMLEVGKPENTFLLAFNDNEPVGYAKLRDDKKPAELAKDAAIEIARIYVTKDAIGKGIGKALMQQCLEIASCLQKDIIWLGVWEKNYKAIDFYISWGFTRFGECTFLLGNDLQLDWLMKKRLTQ